MLVSKASRRRGDSNGEHVSFCHVQPGRMSAIPACVSAEKQNNEPPAMDPNILPRKAIRMAMVISNTFENNWLLGTMKSCRSPSIQPMQKAMGRSISRPSKPKGATHAHAKPSVMY